MVNMFCEITNINNIPIYFLRLKNIDNIEAYIENLFGFCFKIDVIYKLRILPISDDKQLHSISLVTF